MLINEIHLNMINSPVRSFQGKVECYDSTNALVASYTHLDDLQSYQVERVGEGKFFGYGYVQKINIKLLDTKREKSFSTSHRFKLMIGVNDSYVSTFPLFKVTEVHRDEKTNRLSITAYDALKSATEHQYAEIDEATIFDESGYVRLADLADIIARHLGINGALFVSAFDTLPQTLYNKQLLNLVGTETLREVLNYIAEVTQTIYYLDSSNFIIFRKLDRDGEAAYTISKERYVELDSKDNRRLAKVTKATTLGDNVHVALEATGTNQIVMDNPLYELRDDMDTLLAPAADNLLGLTVNQFECEWRGNYLLEIGDKIALECKDGSLAYSYLLDDIFVYDGTVSQETQWEWDDTQNEDETNSAPTTIGEALNQTTARVDKISQEIEMSVDKIEAAVGQSAQLQMKVDEINMTVSRHETEIDELEKKVGLTLTQDDVRIEIEKTLEEGVNKVTTKTGYVFGEEGLEISKSTSEMSTMITDDGMTVYRNNKEVLVANNEGVIAEDLHATTYLIIGTNSRFEDFNKNRTGCFWIGEWKEAE